MRSLVVIESPELLESYGIGSSLALSCNIRLFVTELDYGYRYLLEVCSELSDICFLIWLHYCSMLALHYRPVLAMVNISFLELYQLLQHSYVCSTVMSVHPEGGGSTRDTRVLLTSVDMVSGLDKYCWMSPFPTVCRGSMQVVTALFSTIVILRVRLGGVGRRAIKCCDGLTVISDGHLYSSPLY